jgi:hypothetical protein
MGNAGCTKAASRFWKNGFAIGPARGNFRPLSFVHRVLGDKQFFYFIFKLLQFCFKLFLLGFGKFLHIRIKILKQKLFIFFCLLFNIVVFIIRFYKAG